MQIKMRLFFQNKKRTGVEEVKKNIQSPILHFLEQAGLSNRISTSKSWGAKKQEERQEDERIGDMEAASEGEEGDRGPCGREPKPLFRLAEPRYLALRSDAACQGADQFAFSSPTRFAGRPKAGTFFHFLTDNTLLWKTILSLRELYVEAANGVTDEVKLPQSSN